MRWTALILLVLSLESASLGGETQRTWSTDDGVRILLDTPQRLDSRRETLLLLYALPNGNTIEQTMGARLEPGMNWRFDIQHIGAQVRKLREIDTERNIVLACVEADTKSWPTWRKARPDNTVRINAIVERLRKDLTGRRVSVALVAHSGGGSFIFGYINGHDAIPEDIERIALLDANYGYDDESDQHGRKLLTWLKASPRHRLVVIAYDDRQVTLNGKNIASPTGGTFRATQRMIQHMKDETGLIESKRGEFVAWSGTDGRLRLLIHPNPQRKILHTVLVERNGLIESMTMDTPAEGRWGGAFWGERAYTALVQRAPATTTTATNPQMGIPPRPADAMGGRAFAESIADLPPAAREAAIVQEVLRGNVPAFLRKFREIERDGIRYEVMPDYLAIGSDEDFVRMPMTPQSATAIADAFGCVLPTRKIVNDIYENADLKLEPKPLTQEREAVRTFVEHNDIIEAHRRAASKPLDALVAGHKKDVVISNRLKEKPNRVAIYGWHKPDGKPIQPLYVGHVDQYVDYSHGIRLVKNEVLIDGKPRVLVDLMKDRDLHKLVSDEGCIEEGPGTYR